MENLYLKTKNKETCNGCSACSLVCPVNAIEMKEDIEGFIYPVIDDSKCIHCKACLKICSNYELDKKSIFDVKKYAVQIKDNKILNNSTSGGTFYLILKEHFKNKDSVCYGVRYDKNFEVVHERVESIKDASYFMGSKYVRSNILGIYKKVKDDLENGKNVLFSGTSCQVAGLKTYLKKDYDNLLTINIICKSNPSPLVFKKYIKCLEIKNNSKVKRYSFRSKENGWKNPMPIVEFENGIKFEEDTYMKAFLREVITRPCCFKCKFIKPWNYADITLGDFWGVDKLTKIENFEKGISICLANTDKGDQFIKKINNAIVYELDSNLDVMKFNHNDRVIPHRNRYKFFKKFNKISDDKCIDYINKMSQERLIRRFLKAIKIYK